MKVEVVGMDASEGVGGSGQRATPARPRGCKMLSQRLGRIMSITLAKAPATTPEPPSSSPAP